MTTFLTFNLKDYRRHHSPDELARYQLVEAVIAHKRPDAAAVQELPGHDQTRAETGLLRLAEATGMVCRLGRGYAGPVAVTPGGHDDLAIGLMWRPPIWVAPGSLRIHAGGRWWHALVSVVLHVAPGRVVEHGCYRAPPSAGGQRRPGEARQIVEAMAGRPWPVLAGADWNNPYYFLDHDATVLGWPQPWWDHRHPTLAEANKDAARILTRGGLYDPAMVLGRPRPVTTGHWPTERNGSKPIDGILATGDIVDTINGCFVVDADLARRTSDHLATGVCYDPAQRKDATS